MRVLADVSERGVGTLQAASHAGAPSIALSRRRAKALLPLSRACRSLSTGGVDELCRKVLDMPNVTVQAAQEGSVDSCTQHRNTVLDCTPMESMEARTCTMLVPYIRSPSRPYANNHLSVPLLSRHGNPVRYPLIKTALDSNGIYSSL